MTTLAARDNLINRLQEQIRAHKNFLGSELTKTDANKLRTLMRYLKDNGRGREKDLETITALLMQN